MEVMEGQCHRLCLLLGLVALRRALVNRHNPDLLVLVDAPDHAAPERRPAPRRCCRLRLGEEGLLLTCLAITYICIPVLVRLVPAHIPVLAGVAVVALFNEWAFGCPGGAVHVETSWM